MSTEDRDAREIVLGMSASARIRMASILGEVFSVLENIDVICPLSARVCSNFFAFTSLKALLGALDQAERGDAAEPTELPHTSRPEAPR
jgi:hypothetical protein